MRLKPTIKITKTGPRASFLFAFFLLLLGLQGCSEKKENLAFGGRTMGTTYQIKLVPGDNAIADDLVDRIDNRLQALDDRFTTYQDSSELMVLNRATLDQPHVISEDMQTVLSIAKRVYGLTDGALDPTVKPLVNLWGFGPEYTGDVIPDPDAISVLLSSIGFEYLLLDGKAGTATRKADIQLDLSAVAKGYAVDVIADLLSKEGVTNYLVEVGGELRARGHKQNGELWRIAIEKPTAELGVVYQAISLENEAVATSGDYRNYFEKNGKRYSHTIDPRTGYPIDHALVSVTVIAETTAVADALATAMMVMGSESALMLAEQHKIPTYLLVKEANELKSIPSTTFTQYLAGE